MDRNLCYVVASARDRTTIATTCAFDWQRDCPNDICVVGALQNYTQRLGDHVHDVTAVDEALKFITHFVGDVHQPLHVSKASDRGGNEIPVHVHFDKNEEQDHLTTSSETATSTKTYLRSMSASTTDYSTRRNVETQHESTNLHGVWDNILLETFRMEECHDDWKTLQERVYQVICNAADNGDFTHWIACANGGRHACLDAWAQESWDYARTVAYVHVNGTPIQPHDALPRAYYTVNLPIVLEQLAKASVRLAWTLTFHLDRRR